MLHLLHRYCIEQIETDSCDETKPILIVGTHSDLFSPQERTKLIREMEKTRLPTNQILGHLPVNLLSRGKSFNALKKKLIEVATSHPRIGVGKVVVPQSLLMMQRELEEKRESNTRYLRWGEYVALASSIGMFVQEDIECEVIWPQYS